MMRISEIIEDGETEHFIRWDGVRWEKTDGPKGIRITNGVTITIKSSKRRRPQSKDHWAPQDEKPAWQDY